MRLTLCAVLAISLAACGGGHDQQYTWKDRMPTVDCAPRTPQAQAELRSCPRLAHFPAPHPRRAARNRGLSQPQEPDRRHDRLWRVLPARLRHLDRRSRERRAQALRRTQLPRAATTSRKSSGTSIFQVLRRPSRGKESEGTMKKAMLLLLGICLLAPSAKAQFGLPQVVIDPKSIAVEIEQVGQEIANGTINRATLVQALIIAQQLATTYQLATRMATPLAACRCATSSTGLHGSTPPRATSTATPPPGSGERTLASASRPRTTRPPSRSRSTTPRSSPPCLRPSSRTCSPRYATLELRDGASPDRPPDHRRHSCEFRRRESRPSPISRPTPFPGRAS